MEIAVILIVVLILIIGAIWIGYGGFKTIRFEIRSEGDEVLVYEHYRGDYKNTAGIMDRLYARLLHEDHIETFRGFGIYYDNPQKVNKNELRSDSGCILENPDPATVAQLKEKYNIKTFPRDNYLITGFPYKGRLSVFMGLMRVYPAMHRFMRENKIKEEGFIMEVYDIPRKKIEYRKNL
jgi:hypothetical protein